MEELLMSELELLEDLTQDMIEKGFTKKDVMMVKAVGIYEGINANNALFEAEELTKSYATFKGKPVFILPNRKNKPTGHGYSQKSNTFSNNRISIGYIHNVELVRNENKNRLDVVVTLVLWKKYYPDICRTLVELHYDGQFCLSMECSRKFEVLQNGVRRCYDILFNGICVVENPAFKDSVSMMIAEKLNEGSNSLMNEEQLKQFIDEIKGSVGAEIAEKFVTATSLLVEEKTTLTTKVEELAEALKIEKQAVVEKTEQLADKEAELKEQAEKLQEAQEKIEKIEEEEQAEAKKALGESRLQTLSKHGEVKETAEELAELSTEKWVEKLETVLSSQENASFSGKPLGSYRKTGIESKDKKASKAIKSFLNVEED